MPEPWTRADRQALVSQIADVAMRPIEGYIHRRRPILKSIRPLPLFHRYVSFLVALFIWCVTVAFVAGLLLLIAGWFQHRDQLGELLFGLYPLTLAAIAAMFVLLTAGVTAAVAWKLVHGWWTGTGRAALEVTATAAVTLPLTVEQARVLARHCLAAAADGCRPEPGEEGSDEVWARQVAQVDDVLHVSDICVKLEPLDLQTTRMLVHSRPANFGDLLFDGGHNARNVEAMTTYLRKATRASRA